nr:MAG TPA: hypothetical protein [Caudoviricetes sp.]
MFDMCSQDYWRATPIRHLIGCHWSRPPVIKGLHH